MAVINEVLRQEKKYLITVEEFRKYSHLLEQVLISDEHNGNDGYIIRSLYFDSIYDRDFFDKLNGMQLRRKIRLRIYDTKHDFAMLELKQKEGAQQLKRSLKVTREHAQALCKGNYGCLLTYKEDLAAEFYGIMNMYTYRPKTIIQYNRKAYIAKENSIRITFDNKVIATESNFDIYSEELPMYPALDPFNVILEVKYNGFLLSYIRDLINIADRSEISISKYVMGRSIGYYDDEGED